MPDNAQYYYAAYVSAAVLYAGYILSLAWRARRFREPGKENRGSAVEGRG